MGSGIWQIWWAGPISEQKDQRRGSMMGGAGKAVPFATGAGGSGSKAHPGNWLPECSCCCKRGAPAPPASRPAQHRPVRPVLSAGAMAARGCQAGEPPRTGFLALRGPSTSYVTLGHASRTIGLLGRSYLEETNWWDSASSTRRVPPRWCPCRPKPHSPCTR